jgi:hypothetical protein
MEAIMTPQSLKKRLAIAVLAAMASIVWLAAFVFIPFATA